MNYKSNRKEPVLAENPEDSEKGPLLLTNLVREGLPAPLWRHESNSGPSPLESDVDKANEAQPVPAKQEDQFSMHWEEAKTPSTLDTNPEVANGYAQKDAHWQTGNAPSEMIPQKDFEDNDLENALASIRDKPGQSDALPSGSVPVSEFFSPEPISVSENVVPMPILPQTQESEPTAVEHAENQPQPNITAEHILTNQAEDAKALPDSSLQSPANSTSHFDDKPAIEEPKPAATPEEITFDMEFLKDFEQLLFQEIERRVMNEMEEQMIEHLQKVWKEQLSLTMMRTLALEGIKLRESLAQEMRKSLPEILQRVLHNGLEQIIPTEAD